VSLRISPKTIINAEVIEWVTSRRFTFTHWQLAENREITPRHARRFLDSLEEAGWIERLHRNPSVWRTRKRISNV
jgi:predicted ArsR family transcriptional regulator